MAIKKILIYNLVFAITVFIFSCSNQKSKSSFIGHYTIDNARAIDSTVEHLAGWSITLDTKNNFEIISPQNILGGYWDVSKNNYEGYDLHLQSWAMKASGLIKGDLIYFDKPYKMLDSVFRNVSFIKRGK